ncbi:hypothetical protein BG000_000797 [Podila horticola]|nr:hypothetical protein BG000_000797 [Podila horticola]
MNPIPLHLRHLEALFDHYNVGGRGHFLGESTAFYLSSHPKLPLLPPQGSSPPTQDSSITDQPHSSSTNSNGSPARSEPQLSSPRNDDDSTDPSPLTLTTDPGTHSGGTANAQAYHDPDFPAVANSQAVLSQFPPPALARELIVLFLSKPNRFMPIIPTLFLEEYDAGIPQSPFLLLAIFAITSKYSSDPMHRSDATRAQTAGESYCRTACRLVDEFLDCPRLSTVQGLFLLGKHLEESKNQNVYTKSFMYIGMAVRMAMDMGLNRSCTGWGLEPIQMEYRNRTWWYLYVYDRAQSSCYGRPYLIQDHDCGASKPQPDPLAKNVEQDQADVEHLLHLIQLSTLLGRVITNFYPSNPSVCNFYSSKRFRNSPEDSAIDGKSTSGRKRPKTTNSKNKARDLDESPSGFDATLGSSSTLSEQDHHKEMLARQQLANQKQDELVIELDKELTEWVQGLPVHLQWNTLQEKPSAFGDVLHGIYYAILILLHRPSIRVGELMPTTQNSKQDKCSTSKSSLTTMDGCHSLSVCAQAARRITGIAERCQNLTHLERFGGGAYILLHAARIHLLMAAIPCPPRNNGTEGGEPSPQFMEAVRSKEEAVDMFHRSLGSLRKFSVYHWTVDGISLSIRAMERTLAAILQEQELDKEQELQRQKQYLLDYDSDFMDRDLETSDSSSNTDKEHQLTETPTLPEEPLHEIAYFESMRFLEMRALYRERHHFTEEGSLEQHLQYQQSQSQPKSQLNAGINLAGRRGLLDGAAPAMTYRHVLHNISDLFNKNGE